MIVLDTNVVSEAIKPEPQARVRAWLDAQSAETVFLSTITVAELLFRVAALADGKRKEMLATRIESVLSQFAARILPFDTGAARHYALLAATARTTGRGFPMPDGNIAAIAASRGFTVASRDASAFSAVGVAVVDPWQHGG